jgi:hypothetical protein
MRTGGVGGEAAAARSDRRNCRHGVRGRQLAETPAGETGRSARGFDVEAGCGGAWPATRSRSRSSLVRPPCPHGGTTQQVTGERGGECEGGPHFTRRLWDRLHRSGGQGCTRRNASTVEPPRSVDPDGDGWTLCVGPRRMTGPPTPPRPTRRDKLTADKQPARGEPGGSGPSKGRCFAWYRSIPGTTHDRHQAPGMEVYGWRQGWTINSPITRSPGGANPPLLTGGST